MHLTSRLAIFTWEFEMMPSPYVEPAGPIPPVQIECMMILVVVLDLRTPI